MQLPTIETSRLLLPRFGVRLMIGIPSCGAIGGIEKNPRIYGFSVAIAKKLVVHFAVPCWIKKQVVVCTSPIQQAAFQ